MLVYLTDPKQTPSWSKENTTLEKIFHYGVTGYGGIRSLKQFGLYKDESRDIRHDVYHPMDYVSHDVRIIVGEFDCLEKNKPDNKHVIKEIDRHKDTSILKVKFPIIKNGYKTRRNDEYTNGVFEKLKQDERILFCYVTPSGKGLRFGFKLDERINNDLEYISNYYFYAKEFLKHDSEGVFEIDSNSSVTGSFYELCNVASLYWFLPNTNKWDVKESIKLKKI
jgi:hypothetical protein